MFKTNIIHFRTRKYKFSAPLIIPKGYTVKIDPGCKIDFTNNSFLLSYSPLIVNGVKTKPVEVFSSDKTGQGILVFNAAGDSYVKDVIFDELSSINYGNWKFPGTLTFYKSDVEVIYSSFTNTISGNALSFIASNFNVRFCHFDNANAHAIDIVNAKGNIHKTIFNHVNENALDITSSQVFIEESEFDNCSATCIYSRRKSETQVHKTTIKHSKVAIISSDLSEVLLKSVQINDCKIGLVAFHNMPVFGPGLISTNLTTLYNLQNDYMLEINSTLIFNDDTIPGIDKNIAPLFYSKQEN